jgi:predicted GTPase
MQQPTGDDPGRERRPYHSAELLAEVKQIAEEAEARSIASEAENLLQRAAEGRFHIACVGMFKRGKSTLVNALVGQEVLPTGVVPVTSVPTVVRYGTPHARVKLHNGGWLAVAVDSLAEYVSEEKNPGNCRGIAAVEVFVPSPLLAEGMCFVDTPGLGSVFQANTQATLAFLPQIDAALVTLGADPPISGEEIQLLEEIGSDVQHLIFVLNKADRVSEAELREAADFARRILHQRLHRRVDAVFSISAMERASHGVRSRDWDALERHLTELASKSGKDIVQAAVQRGTRRLSERLERVLRDTSEALQKPLEETEHRLQTLRAAVKDATVALNDLGPLFAAEETRLMLQFSRRREEFCTRVGEAARRQLCGTLRQDSAELKTLRSRAFTAAREIAEGYLETWLAETRALADAAFASAAERFERLGAELLLRLREQNVWAELEEEPVGAPLDPQQPHLSGSFHFTPLEHIASSAGIAALLKHAADVLGPRSLTVRRVQADAAAYLNRVLEANAWRVENDLHARISARRSSLEHRIKDALLSALEEAEQSLEHARRVQQSGAEAVRKDLQRIEKLLSQLRETCRRST